MLIQHVVPKETGNKENGHTWKHAFIWCSRARKYRAVIKRSLSELHRWPGAVFPRYCGMRKTRCKKHGQGDPILIKKWPRNLVCMYLYQRVYAHPWVCSWVSSSTLIIFKIERVTKLQRYPNLLPLPLLWMYTSRSCWGAAGDLAPLTCQWTLQAFWITKQGDVLGNPWMSVLTLPTSWWVGCGTFNDLMSATYSRGLWSGIVLLNCLPGTFSDGVSFHRLLMESLKIHWVSI